MTSMTCTVVVACAVTTPTPMCSNWRTDAAASVRQLEHIGVGVVTAQATTTVQVMEVIGRLYPSERYGSLVVLNDSGAAMHSDAAEIHIVLDPIFEEVQ